jgi:hypothetical protein
MGTWESTGTPKTSEFDFKGQNTSHWGFLYIIAKLSRCKCRKWACMSHLDICSTSYDKKERPRVKLAIWLPTTKSQESTRPQCVQVNCNTPLKSSQWGLELFFRPHRNQRSTQEVMCLQSHGSPNCCNFRTPTWESQKKKPFRCGPVESCIVYYMGEGGGFPRV